MNARGPTLVLASSSSTRRAVLARAGLEALVVSPGFDERSLDRHFEEWGSDRYVVEVALGKARSVVSQVPTGAFVIGADQIAVLDGRLLTKPGTIDGAVAQLVSMSERTHDLINGVAMLEAETGRFVTAVDRHVVTMRCYEESEARRYVEEYLPLECVGAYRIEDDAGLIESIAGSGDDGVIGLPIVLVRALVAELGDEVGSSGDPRALG